MTSLGGPLVLCFGALDEADIVRDFLEYHLSLGIERFVAVDVGSTDGTLEILRRHEQTGRLRLISRHDPTAHGENWLGDIVKLAREAFRPSWFLFCDVDEFWVFPEGDAPAYFAVAPAPIVTFPRFNMLPSPGRVSGEAACYREFDLVVRRPLQFLYDLERIAQPGGPEWTLNAQPPDILRFVGPKITARADAFHQVKSGFHDVEPVAPTVPRAVESCGYVVHFQVRDAERFVNKARRVAEFTAENPPHKNSTTSRHWVRLAALYRHGLVRAEYARQILSPEQIAACLRDGIVERDDRIATRLAHLIEKSPR